MLTRTKTKILVFLGLTLVFSSLFYALIIAVGPDQAHPGLFVYGLMWSPGVAALLTQLFFERSIAGLGWGWGPTKYQVWGYLIPPAYCLVAYSALWASGLAGVPNREFMNQVSELVGLSDRPDTAMAVYVLLCATLGVALSCTSALGEEIGWRGFLVPQLASMMSFSKVALVSGLIWSLWHYPLIVFSEYHSAAPRWYALMCFTTMAMGLSFCLAWLRLKSLSVWSSMLLHASHNLFVQAVFTPLSTDTGPTRYWTDEFGAALAIATVLVALIFWSRRSELAAAKPPITC